MNCGFFDVCKYNHSDGEAIVLKKDRYLPTFKQWRNFREINIKQILLDCLINDKNEMKYVYPISRNFYSLKNGKLTEWRLIYT